MSWDRPRRLVLLLVLFFPTLALAANPQTKPGSRPKPRFDRPAPGRDEPRARPEVPPAPADLEPPSTGGGSVEAQARSGRTSHDEEIAARGAEAGGQMADELARREGRRELYRAGVYDGEHRALDDPAIGRRDYEEGLRLGRFDPGAREAGADEGYRAAEDAAERDAPLQVERQFRDLAWRPVPAPRPGSAGFTPDLAPTSPPELDPLFDEYPISRVPWAFRGMVAELEGGRYTPQRLYHCGGRREFYDGSWQDPARAFRLFASDPRASGFLRKLDGRGRSVFEAAFREGFLDRLPFAYDRIARRAYGEGFEDGWDYGAFLRAEWSFRLGYTAGFDAGLAVAAEAAFDRGYPPAYSQAYGRAFDTWMSSVRPAILTTRLADAGDDGIFEPGEELEVDYVVANYGGAGGVRAVRVEGPALRAPVETEVKLAPRSRTAAPVPLRAVVDPGVPVPSREIVHLRVGEERSDLPLRVSYPLEFTGDVSYRSEPLDGRAGVLFTVVNRSRKPVRDVVVAREDDRGPEALLGVVEPAARADAELVLENVPPLELLGGTLVVRAAVRSGGQVHDRHEARFPDKATRLDDPDLVFYLARLGKDRDPDVGEIVGARRLLMQRLEADWQARCAEDGNAYEQDLRDRGTRTALAELARAYEKDQGALRSSAAWNGLDREIAELAERLPGVHPNLRRSMKKLAAGLD